MEIDLSSVIAGSVFINLRADFDAKRVRIDDLRVEIENCFWSSLIGLGLELAPVAMNVAPSDPLVAASLRSVH